MNFKMEELLAIIRRNANHNKCDICAKAFEELDKLLADKQNVNLVEISFSVEMNSNELHLEEVKRFA